MGRKRKADDSEPEEQPPQKKESKSEKRARLQAQAADWSVNVDQAEREKKGLTVFGSAAKKLTSVSKPSPSTKSNIVSSGPTLKKPRSETTTTKKKSSAQSPARTKKTTTPKKSSTTTGTTTAAATTASIQPNMMPTSPVFPPVSAQPPFVGMNSNNMAQQGMPYQQQAPTMTMNMNPYQFGQTNTDQLALLNLIRQQQMYPQQMQPLQQQLQQQQMYTQQGYNSSYTGNGFNGYAAAQDFHPTVGQSATPTVLSPPPVASTTKSKSQTASQKKSTARPSKKSASSMPRPPPTAASATKNDSDSDDDGDVTPPGLYAQVSQQVVANAKADMQNQPPPYTEDPSGTLDDAATEETAEDDGGLEDSRADLDRTLKHFKIAKLALLIMGAVAVGLVTVTCYPFFLSSVSFEIVGDAISDIITKIEKITPHQKVPCYFSSPFHGEPVDESFCPDGGLPCPAGGVCQLGKFLKCQNRYQKINKATDGCENTSQYKMITAKLQARLEFESMNALGCDQSDEMPMFLYSAIQQAHPNDLVELNT